MRSNAWRAFVGALTALTVLIFAPAAAGDRPGDHPHATADGVADTPFEAQELLDDQHGGVGGHLPGSSLNVELVGQVTVSNIVPGRISDVGVLGNYAYLGAFNQPCGSGGV